MFSFLGMAFSTIMTKVIISMMILELELELEATAEVSLRVRPAL